MLEKHQLTRPNFNEWFRALKLVVHTEKLHDVFETALPPAPAVGANAQALADWAVLFYRHNEVACLMLGTMSPKLYHQFEHNSPLEMVTELQKMYGKPPGVELQELVNMFHSCKQAEGQSIKRKQAAIVGASSYYHHVMAILKREKRSGKVGQCHHCKEEGHWKRNCPLYLAELMKKKKTGGQNVASTSSGSIPDHDVSILKVKCIVSGILMNCYYKALYRTLNANVAVDYVRGMQSMNDNKVWKLVRASPNAKVVKRMKRMQNVPYASAVGSIMYVVRCTRPDVAFAQNITSRFQQNHGEAHWTTVKNILKYLRNTKNTFLVYGGNPEVELEVKCFVMLDIRGR
ncbi:zinc finger, CCHC-type containing protein [Tanacetum coccineum]